MTGATDTCLNADTEIASFIPAWSHNFVEIDHAFSSLEGLLSVTNKSMCTKYWLTVSSKWPRKTDHPDMTIAVDRDLNNQTKPKNQNINDQLEDNSY